MYCISCGKKGVYWPKHNPEACSMRCLAWRVLGEYGGGGDGFFCPVCGPEHLDATCRAYQEEQVHE